MANRTEREFQLALSKLLNRVRSTNDWSNKSFMSCAEYVVNVTPAEAKRFHKAMVEFNYLTVGNDRRKLTSNFTVKVWKNEDSMLDMIRDILECSPDIVQTRGRKKGVSPFRKEKEVEQPEVVEPTPQEDIEPDPYEGITLVEAIKLVKEIASRNGLIANITLS